MIGGLLISSNWSTLSCFWNGLGGYIPLGKDDKIMFLSYMQCSGKLLTKLKWKSDKNSGKSCKITNTTLNVAS